MSAVPAADNPPVELLCSSKSDMFVVSTLVIPLLSLLLAVLLSMLTQATAATEHTTTVMLFKSMFVRGSMWTVYSCTRSFACSTSLKDIGISHGADHCPCHQAAGARSRTVNSSSNGVRGDEVTCYLSVGARICYTECSPRAHDHHSSDA
jgi:hypothetical protein